MRKVASLLTVMSLLLVAASVASATVYEIGPGKPYTNIGDMPWESLVAGDTVNIYYRATPYKEKIALGAVGTQSQPILIHGVAGPGGELPVLDGQNATTRLEWVTGSEARGIITMQQDTVVPAPCRPAWITIENLEFTGASYPYTFTDDAGLTQSYPYSAAGIWITDGRNITVRNCYFHDLGNGFFTYTEDDGCDVLDAGHPRRRLLDDRVRLRRQEHRARQLLPRATGLPSSTTVTARRAAATQTPSATPSRTAAPAWSCATTG